MQQRTPLDLDLIVRVYAPAQVMKAGKNPGTGRAFLVGLHARVVRQTLVRANNFHPAPRGRTANRARQNIPQ